MPCVLNFFVFYLFRCSSGHNLVELGMRVGLAVVVVPGIEAVLGSGTALVMMEPGIVAAVAGLGTGLVVVALGIALVRVELDIVEVEQAGMGPGSLDLVGQVELTCPFASASADGRPGMLRTRSSSSRGSSPRASRTLCIHCVA